MAKPQDLPAELMLEVLTHLTVEDLIPLIHIPLFHSVVSSQYILITSSARSPKVTYFKHFESICKTMTLTEILSSTHQDFSTTAIFLIETNTIYELIHNPQLIPFLQRYKCQIAINDYTKIKFLQQSTKSWLEQIRSQCPLVTIIHKEGLSKTSHDIFVNAEVLMAYGKEHVQLVSSL